MEQSYELPTVELHRDDLKWLWDKLLELFEPSVGDETRRMVTEVSADTGGMSVSETELDLLLNSGLLGDKLSSLSFTVSAAYGPPKRKDEHGFVPWDPDTSSRRISLSFGGVLGTRIRLSGVQDWIERVHGSLDAFLRSKKRDKRAERWLVSLVLAVVPGISIGVRAFRLDSVALVYAALFWSLVSLFVSSSFTAKIYPDNLIVVSERAMRLPWYLDLARQVFVGIVVLAIVTVLVSVLWPS